MFGARKRKLTGKSPLKRAFNNGCKEHLTSLIARMFYSGGIPFHFARTHIMLILISMRLTI